MKRYLLPIIVSAVSLVVIAVVSYAYFTATIDPSGETTATIRTATVGTVTFVTTSPTSNLTDVLPGWEGQGSTTVYFNNNSDDDVAYHCTVSLENNSYATNVYIQTLSGSDAQVPSETALTSEGVTVSQGTLEAQSDITSPNHGAEHVVTYKIIFKEIGQAQNDDQGRTINTYTTCVIDQQSGSALTLVSGTMTDLSGDPIANQAMVAFSSPTYFTTDAQGHYEVRLASGAHNIYYVPGMSMADLVEEGKEILTNENAVTKSVTVTAGNTQTINPVVNINAPTKTVSVTCTNCMADASSANVEVGGTASFTITADEGYTLEGATVTGGCTLSNGTLTLTNVSEDTTCAVSAVQITLVAKILSDNTVYSSRTNFSTVFDENTTNIIYSTDRTDDNSTVYYYAGNTTNNWVIFGNNGRGTYYYWRIIRTNSNEEGGGVRLLYSGSGTSATTVPNDLNNALVSTEISGGVSNSAALGAYMYSNDSQHGHDNNSRVKNRVDSWYSNSGISNFENYINFDAVYCSDRSLNSGTTWRKTATWSFSYAAYIRLVDNKYPTHKCGGNTSGGYFESAANRLEDRFSATTNGGGNGYLTYPIALMTADELVFSGGLFNTNAQNVWFNTNGNGDMITDTYNGSWITMTPSRYVYSQYGSGGNAFIIKVYKGYNEYGQISENQDYYTRPVLSLKASVLVQNSDANGTTSHPYIITN